MIPDHHHHHGAGYREAADHLQPAFIQHDLNMAIITIILTLLGLSFNLMIFYVFWGMRQSGSAMIFLNLAAVDILLTCVSMPFSVTTLLIRSNGARVPHGHVFCAVAGCLFETCVLCTLGFVLLASLDRFLGVYHPIYHRKYFNRTNLIKMILSVWTISPLVILLYVILWILLSSAPLDQTYTNKAIFTTCIGQYWFKTDDHVFHNAPNYISLSLLSFLMLFVVISNLAVLKQLFRKKPKPLESLQPAAAAGRNRKRRNNTTMRTPPIVIQPDGSSVSGGSGARVAVAREQLKRISLAEQSVKKSERIFQTDSHGDIIGINIKAIIKLYLMATRASQACLSRCKPNDELDSGTIVEEEDSGGKEESSHPVPQLATTEECEEGECEEGEKVFVETEDVAPVQEKRDDEEVVDSEQQLYLDADELEMGSLSDFPEDDETVSDEIDYEVVWKVIKFVYTLKRNSRRRQASELTRCSSDTDISLVGESTDTTASKPLNRKFSEMSVGTRSSSRPSLPYEVPGCLEDSDNPTVEEIHEMVNGGELSPLVRRHKIKTPDLASITRFASEIKKRSKEKVLIHRRSTVALLSTLGGRKASTASLITTPLHSDTSIDKPETGTQPNSWGTLVTIARIKNKLMRNKTPQSEPNSVQPSKTELITIPEEHPNEPVLMNTVSEEGEIKPDPVIIEKTTENLEHLLAVPFNSSLTIPTPQTQDEDCAIVAGVPPVMGRRRQGGVNHTRPPLPGDGQGARRVSIAGTKTGGEPPSICQRVRDSSVYRMSRSSMNISGVAQMVYNFNKQARKKKKEIRAAKTIIILVFYYIITLLLFIFAFYHVTMMSDAAKGTIPYWLTFYSYIIYLNAVFNPVIHFWRNAKVRATVMKIICPNVVNEKIRRWKLRGGF